MDVFFNEFSGRRFDPNTEIRAIVFEAEGYSLFRQRFDEVLTTPPQLSAVGVFTVSTGGDHTMAIGRDGSL